MSMSDAAVRARWVLTYNIQRGLLAGVRRDLADAERGLAWARKNKRPTVKRREGKVSDLRKRVAMREQKVAEAKRVIDRHTTLPLRLKAWAEMQKLIDAHITEQGGNNLGREVVRIIREAGGTPGEAWCGDTVMVCYLRAGAKTVQRAWASVSWLNRLLAAVPRSLVRQGHVVTYVFDHTGLFDRWAPEHGPGYFWAGEGNTGDSGAVSDSQTGTDGVKLKLRHVNQVSAFRRVRA